MKKILIIAIMLVSIFVLPVNAEAIFPEELDNSTAGLTTIDGMEELKFGYEIATDASARSFELSDGLLFVIAIGMIVITYFIAKDISLANESKNQKK